MSKIVEFSAETTEKKKSKPQRDNFIGWLKAEFFLVSQLAVLTSALYFLVSFFYYIGHGEYNEYLEPRVVQKGLYFANFIVLVIFIVWLIWILNINDKNSHKAEITYKRIFLRKIASWQLENGEKQLKRFKKVFLMFWISVGLFYAAFIVQYFWQEQLPPTGKREFFLLIKDLQQYVDSDDESADGQKKIEEKINHIEMLVGNSPEAKENSAEHKVFTEFRMLQDSDLKEKIGEVVRILSTNGNPTAEKDRGIYDEILMAFNATDPEMRKSFLNHAKTEVKNAKNELERTARESNTPKSADEEEIDRRRLQTFLSIENIDTDHLNHNFGPKVLKQRLGSVIKSIDSIGFGDTTSVKEQTGELLRTAYETKDPLMREMTLKKGVEVDSRENYYSQTKWKLGFSFFMYFINNAGSLTLLMCFFILTSTSADKESRKSEKRKIRLAILGFIGVILAFLTILSPFFKGISETELTSWIVCFDGLSGVLSGVTLALLIARLDSKLLDLPHHLIVTMYFYAAFQPLFVVFELPGEIPLIIKTTVLFAVFATKIYFFLIVTFAMQTGRMLTYFCCFPTLAKRVDSIFANQFLIVGKEKGDHFKFSILKQDREIYTGKLHSSDESAFFKKLDELREAVKLTTRVKIRPTTAHQYKIEIVGKDNKEVICESIDLAMSKKEAEELKIESRNSIPYCDARLVNKGKIIQLTPNESIHSDPESVSDITDSEEADHI